MSNNFDSISKYLSDHCILTLATIDNEGKPSLSTVDYMWTGKSLLFFTDARTRKAANIAKNSFATAMVTDQNANFFEAKSVEIIGNVHQSLDQEKIGAYMQSFMSRRPQFASLPPDPEMQKNMWVFELSPIKLRMLDNTIAPSHVDEIIV